MVNIRYCVFFFFFNDTATTEIYTLSLHDALPICPCHRRSRMPSSHLYFWTRDRKSTRLNSSHSQISYAVFCLKKKKQFKKNQLQDKERNKPEKHIKQPQHN